MRAACFGPALGGAPLRARRSRSLRKRRAPWFRVLLACGEASPRLRRGFASPIWLFQKYLLLLSDNFKFYNYGYYFIYRSGQGPEISR